MPEDPDEPHPPAKMTIRAKRPAATIVDRECAIVIILRCEGTGVAAERRPLPAMFYLDSLEHGLIIYSAVFRIKGREVLFSRHRNSP